MEITIFADECRCYSASLTRTCSGKLHFRVMDSREVQVIDHIVDCLSACEVAWECYLTKLSIHVAEQLGKLWRAAYGAT